MPEEAIPPGADFGRLVAQRSEVMVVAPNTHPLASLSEVKLGNLRHETWICTESPDHSHRHFVTHSCRLAGFAPTFGRSASTLEGVLGRVSAGYGIALMPTAVTLPERLGLHAVRTDCPSFAICAVWNERENSALLRNFVDVLRGLVNPTPVVRVALTPALVNGPGGSHPSLSRSQV